MAINSSTQHVLENLLNCFTFVDTKKQLVIAYPVFLHLGYTKESAQAILSKPMLLQYTNCKDFVPREDLFISIPQIGELIVNAPKTKYVSNILEFIKNTLIPLFNAQPQIKHDDFKKEIDMNTLTSNQPLTMSSLDIAELCDKRHSHVMADIKNMLEQLEMNSAEFSAQYKDKSGKTNPCFNLDKEMSLTLVAGYNVKLRHKIIKRWQELENQLSGIQPQIRQQPIAALPTAKELAQMVIKSEVEKENLLLENANLQHQRDELNKTKMQISSKREASALGKLARANDKIKQLQMVAKLETNLADKVSKISHATVLAIQSRVSNLKANGLKLGNYCRKNGLEIQNIPEPRFGVVHSYPAEAWQNVYNVNINSILGA